MMLRSFKISNVISQHKQKVFCTTRIPYQVNSAYISHGFSGGDRSQSQGGGFSGGDRSQSQGGGFSGGDQSRRIGVAWLVGSAVSAAAVGYAFHGKRPEVVLAATAGGRPQAGERRSDLPTFGMEEVAKHSDPADRVWITFSEGVYDVTDFVKKHPGGQAIMMAAGGSADPFWSLYAVHKQEHVLQLLEQYRIGNVASQDVGAHMEGVAEDAWAREPRRHPALRPSSKTPYNAEPPPELLADSFVTPTDLFYVRNHLPVPSVEADSYRLEVDDENGDIGAVSLSLHELKTKFAPVTVTATVMCAGNRRSEMSAVKAVRGLSWGNAAVGNATWTGARLSDVLAAAGFDPTRSRARHVCFEGLDTDPTSTPYGASIPLEKVLDPSGDVILAYSMNGAPLSRDHGFPVRAIVPGVVGARNVKWLGRVYLSESESPSHWQRSDYKGFSPSVDWDTVDFSRSPAIQNLPVNSSICWPTAGQTVEAAGRAVECRGYAWSGGGQGIVRVDVSGDGGASWHEAQLTHSETNTAHSRCWSWTLWKARVPVPEGVTDAQICVKAVDSSYNTQPESFENIWNLRGVLSNAYHRVNVQIKR